MQTTTKKMSNFEYEKLPEGQPQQLIDGEVIMSPSPSAIHQSIVLELAALLKNHIDKNLLGYLFIAPIDVFLREGEVYQPDIIFISKKNKNIIHEKIKGVPDIVVEVLSPSTAYYDLVHKKNIYEETGVKEFWVIDPDGKTVEIYENVSNAYRLFSKVRTSGTISSKLLDGFNLKVENLFLQPGVGSHDDG
jgi:Uma2 family endonuclease